MISLSLRLTQTRSQRLRLRLGVGLIQSSLSTWIRRAYIPQPCFYVVLYAPDVMPKTLRAMLSRHQ